jgi:predicted phosphodiesterase
MRSLWCERRSDFGPGRIGLMADSHGDSAAIAAAVARFMACGCNWIVHLGDICDSTDPTTASACVAELLLPKILAVRGNNDHALASDAAAALDERTRSWLAGLPVCIETPSALFTHNRVPFARLGFSSLFGDLDDSQALAYLRSAPGRLLFRGHSHHCLIRRLCSGKITCQVPPVDQGLPIRGGAVITCGSLEQGTALVWDTETAMVRRICL